MSPMACDVRWELDGRLPVLSGHGRSRVSEDESQTAEEVMKSAGAVLFQGFDLSVDEFRKLTERLGKSFALEKWTPHSTSGAGPHIGLHTEQAFLPALPSALWFYSAKPAERGGATVLCDGAAVVSELRSSTRRFLEETDVLYWRRFSGRPPSGPYLQVVGDPPGLGRSFREHETIVHDDFYETTVLCRPLIHSRHGRRRVFGNHILNTLKHHEKDQPPPLDGFHQARLPTKEPLPDDLIEEVKEVTSRLCMVFKLGEKDMVWIDNTRLMHGRNSFEGSRQILAMKAFYADQWLPGYDPADYPSRTVRPRPVAAR